MMKKYLFLYAIGIFALKLSGQASLNKEFSLKDLDVPNSPAFQLLDAAPSNISSAYTPKEFALGVVQNIDKDTKWFDNYSMEFSPYWWFKLKKQNFYTFSGLKEDTVKKTYKNNPFGSLKFASVSLALLNKDMIPDGIDAKHRIISGGFRCVVLKLHNKKHAEAILNEINEWNDEAQKELVVWEDEINKAPDMNQKKVLLKKYLNAKPEATTKHSKKINDLVTEKPIFSITIAGAGSAYGLGDTVWKAGKTGIWSNFAFFFPLQKESPCTNYFNLEILGRFTEDNYYKNDSGILVYSHSKDAGLRLGFEFDRLTIACEMFARSANGTSKNDIQTKVTGILNYKIDDNLYATGTFGRDFGPGKKLITLFGINWGFGSEKSELK